MKGKGKGFRQETTALLLQGAFARTAEQELGTDPDEARAVRRALLSLIWLAQENLSDEPCSRAARDFIDYLLTKFEPLASRFENERHCLLAGEDARRAHLPDGKMGVLIRQEFGHLLIAQGMELLQADLDESIDEVAAAG